MNVLIVSGSRNPEGQTARAANAFLQGASDAGGQGEVVFLPKMRIELCRQCDDAGWGICRSEGKCVIDDDFAPIVERIKNADLVAFATPVYFGDLSESLRAFLDRLRRTCVNQSAKQAIAGRIAVGICIAGGGGGGAPECTVSLGKVLGTCGFDVADMIPVRRQNLELKLRLLRLVGESLAESTDQAQ